MSKFDLGKIKLIVGLGNVGKEYTQTRHNAGFLWMDALAQKYGANWSLESSLKGEVAKIRVMLPPPEDPDGQRSNAPIDRLIILLKPITMMNSSGQAVRLAMDYYKLWPQNVLVAHDDLDIALGNWKLSFHKAPKVHNGLLSVNKQLGTDKYWHARLGIDARTIKGNKGIPGLKYSLERFRPDEMELFQKSVAESLTEVLKQAI